MRGILIIGGIILAFRLLCIVFRILETFSVLLLFVWILALLYKGIQSLLARRR